MTAQEVFDKSARHLLTQMKKSGEMSKDAAGEDYFACKYRGRMEHLQD